MAAVKPPNPSPVNSTEPRMISVVAAAPGWLRVLAQATRDSAEASLASAPAPIVGWITTTDGTFPLVPGEPPVLAADSWRDAAAIAPGGDVYSSEEEVFSSVDEWLEARAARWRWREEQAVIKRRAEVQQAQGGTQTNG